MHARNIYRARYTDCRNMGLLIQKKFFASALHSVHTTNLKLFWDHFDAHRRYKICTSWPKKPDWFYENFVDLWHEKFKNWNCQWRRPEWLKIARNRPRLLKENCLTVSYVHKICHVVWKTVMTSLWFPFSAQVVFVHISKMVIKVM